LVTLKLMIFGDILQVPMEISVFVIVIIWAFCSFISRSMESSEPFCPKRLS
jgi:hypothetical protein